MKGLSRMPSAFAIVSIFSLPLLGYVASADPVLPDAVSYEYFGLNFANNIQTSNTVGTLDYSGGPGCGGTCTATTELGAVPSVTATVNEVVYQNTSGGLVQASLEYYVEYLNNTPGTYSVNLHSVYSLSAPDGQTAASEALTFGTPGGHPTALGNFATTTLQEANCVIRCPEAGFVTGTGPLAPDNTVQMVANTLYLVEMDLLFAAQPTNVQASASLDPVFSTTSGGRFIFSPGVVSAVPEPATWLIMIFGLLAIGIVARSTPSMIGSSAVALLPLDDA